jgi:hypothetical protein
MPALYEDPISLRADNCTYIHTYIHTYNLLKNRNLEDREGDESITKDDLSEISGEDER